MTAGLQIIGTSGAVQADQDYKNLIFISKTTVTTTNVLGSGSYVDVTITGVSSAAMVAFTSANDVGMSGMSVPVAGQLKFRFKSAGTTGTAITYYVFDTPPTTSSNHLGLQIFNASGQLTFDSSFKYMKIVDFLGTVSANPASVARVDHTYTAGHTYAVIVGNAGFWSNVLGGMTWQSYLISVKSITNGIETFAVMYTSGPTGLATNQTGSFLVVDVTGL